MPQKVPILHFYAFTYESDTVDTGTQVAVFDVDAAFRNVPLHPSVWPHVALFFLGMVYLDLCLNFGIRSAPGLFGNIADALVKIFLFFGVEAVLKWVDDFIFFRYPKHCLADGSYVYSYDASLVWSIAETLGWPWAPKKFKDFDFIFTYIGFLWSLTDRTVELPDEKKAKYLARLQPWLTPHAKMSMSEAETLIGTLNHVCLVVPAGRAYLTKLYAFRSSFKHKEKSGYRRHTVNLQTWEDLQWWFGQLSQDFLGLHIKEIPALSPISLFVDASTGWGIGLIINGKWLAWEFRPGWQGPNNERHIGWGEMVAVELAVRTLVTSGYSGSRFLIRSDNEGVVGALKKGNSRGHEQNLILRKIVKLMQEHGIWVKCSWVSTHDNPANDPSRGVFPPRSQLYHKPPKVPRHLEKYVDKSVTPNDPRVLAQKLTQTQS